MFPMRNRKLEIWLRGYKTVFMLMKFQLPIEAKMLKKKFFLAFKLADVVFIMLIKVKMPTNYWHFNSMIND